MIRNYIGLYSFGEIDKTVLDVTISALEKIISSTWLYIQFGALAIISSAFANQSLATPLLYVQTSQM